MRTQTGDAAGTLDTRGPGTGQAEKSDVVYPDLGDRVGLPPRSALERGDVPIPEAVMTAVSTFSGVGGMDRGLELAGIESVLMSEMDEWCQAVLRHRFPRATVVGDVRDVTIDTVTAAIGARDERGVQEGNEGAWAGPARAVGGGSGIGHPVDARNGSARLGIDLLHGGFPCQDVSVAGRRAGLEGARTGLFFEFARIADALRPEWLLLENVPGLLTSNGGRDFGVVLATLAELGYGVAWRVLDSRYFGVPQRRRRVFIVGRAGGDSRSALSALCESCPGSPSASRSTWQGATGGPRGRAPGGGIVNALTKTQGGPDDNDAQAGHLVPMLAATISKVSAASPGVNPPGRRQEDDYNLVPTLRSHPRPGSVGAGAVAFKTSDLDNPRDDGLTPPLTVNKNGQGTGSGASVMAQVGIGVRRLTPRECERLQGFPDDWTLVDDVKSSDSRRYAAMGNAVTTNVAEWIARRIVAIHSASLDSAE